jgi:undecaprenyl-diphosphatase
MSLSLLQIVILALIQGLAELLPVSSSAHVIAAAKLMGIDPSSPQFTLLLVMLHTGTMFAVILYFWKAWKQVFFSSRERTMQFVRVIVIATIVTGIIALGLKVVLEKLIAHQHPGIGKAEIEELFKHLEILAGALAAAGVLIVVAGLRSQRQGGQAGREEITDQDAVIIGAVQGLSLPFRGFSRSGSTISAGLLLGVAKTRLEQYSFALSVVLTPAVVVWEGRRLLHSPGQTGGPPVGVHDFVPGLLGMVFSFIGGLLALRLLSQLLERGKWWVFGVYCFLAAGGVFAMYLRGY